MLLLLRLKGNFLWFTNLRASRGMKERKEKKQGLRFSAIKTSPPRTQPIMS